MGNEQSKKSPTIEIELNHSRINFVRVINQPKKRFMQAVFAVQKNDYDTWKLAVEKAKLHTTNLLIPFQHSFESKEFCGTAGSVKANYDNFPYLLVEEIENRRAKKKRFDETELWLLLYSLLDAQKQIKAGNRSRIGDVRPQNIFLNEEGQMRVASVLSWPRQSSNYQKFLQNQPTYLAPEDLALVETAKIDNSENSQSEIFSIGLTLLSVANLTDYKTLYSTTARKFHLQKFSQILNEWRVNDYYSDIFKATLCSLLEIDPQHRITQEQLFIWIEKYRQKILARKDFVITDPPVLVIQQVKIIRSLYQNVASNYSLQNPPFINPSIGSEFKRIGVPLQGSRKLVEEIRHPPISLIPTTTINDSVYKPDSTFKPGDHSSYLSKFLLQGAPIGSNAAFFNRYSVGQVENPNLVESVYAQNWSSQGGQTIPRTNFEYGSAQKSVQPVHSQAQNNYEQKTPQQSNQPEIQEDQNDKQPSHQE